MYIRSFHSVFTQVLIAFAVIATLCGLISHVTFFEAKNQSYQVMREKNFHKNVPRYLNCSI